MSADRRSVIADPACGGNVYAHIVYERQLALKGEVIAMPSSALRACRCPGRSRSWLRRSMGTGCVPASMSEAAPSASSARGPTSLCDPAVTGQLLPETSDLIARLSFRMRGEQSGGVASIELAENLDASNRALHLECDRLVAAAPLADLFDDAGLTGVSLSAVGEPSDSTVSGSPFVADRFEVVHRGGGTAPVTLRRHARAFFQANRYLLPRLLARVLELIPGGPVVDLYAGVGLFAVSLAAAGHESVSAVEGDRTSAADLRENAKPYGSTLRTFVMPVERFVDASRLTRPSTLILDPPRSGMSKEALAGVPQTAGAADRLRLV